MKLLNFFIAILLLSIGFQSTAQSGQQLAGFAEDINIDKKQMVKSIEMLRKSGRISDEQAKEAIQKLDGYSQDDINAIKTQAIKKIESGDTPKSMLPSSGPNPRKEVGDSNSGNDGAKDNELQDKLKESSEYKQALDYLNN